MSSIHLEDLEFLGEGNKKINIKNINSHNFCAAKFVGNSKRKRSKIDSFYYLNDKDQCPMRAILSITFRALRLKVDTKGPLAVYATGAKHNTVKYITNVNVEKYLREIAITTYDLEDKKHTEIHMSLHTSWCMCIATRNKVST